VRNLVFYTNLYLNSVPVDTRFSHKRTVRPIAVGYIGARLKKFVWDLIYIPRLIWLRLPF